MSSAAATVTASRTMYLVAVRRVLARCAWILPRRRNICARVPPSRAAAIKTRFKTWTWNLVAEFLGGSMMIFVA